MTRRIKPPASPQRALLRIKAKREALVLAEERRLAGEAARERGCHRAKAAKAERERRTEEIVNRYSSRRPLTPEQRALQDHIVESAHAKSDAAWAKLLAEHDAKLVPGDEKPA
ncbi:hypothetical protein [Parvularcula oceani]|uniref:hypothetical protein n=1 Tax=Parvularcula oceani TaxID=1247963 RepID=UPI0004E12B53|nr:hypothetical protein [Parvularcula oceani]